MLRLERVPTLFVAYARVLFGRGGRGLCWKECKICVAGIRRRKRSTPCSPTAPPDAYSGTRIMWFIQSSGVAGFPLPTHAGISTRCRSFPPSVLSLSRSKGIPPTLFPFFFLLSSHPCSPCLPHAAYLVCHVLPNLRRLASSHAHCLISQSLFFLARLAFSRAPCLIHIVASPHLVRLAFYQTPCLGSHALPYFTRIGPHLIHPADLDLSHLALLTRGEGSTATSRRFGSWRAKPRRAARRAGWGPA